MARIVDPSKSPFREDRAPQIDWRRWLDGNEWELTQGKDFTQSANKARKALLMWAYRRGYRVSTRVREGREGKPDKLYVRGWPTSDEDTKQ